MRGAQLDQELERPRSGRGTTLREAPRILPSDTGEGPLHEPLELLVGRLGVRIGQVHAVELHPRSLRQARSLGNARRWVTHPPRSISSSPVGSGGELHDAEREPVVAYAVSSQPHREQPGALEPVRHSERADVERAEPEALDEGRHAGLGLRVVAREEDVGATLAACNAQRVMTGQ